jgi:predicted nucleic acid-binding protein
MMPCIVDTSVAFKWYRQIDDEEYVQQAIAILESHLNGDLEIYVPDLLIYELGNILRFKEDLASESAISIIRKTFLLEIKIHAIDLPFAEEAFRLAKKYTITFYDASFLALSHILNCVLITADRKLYTKIKSFPNAKFLGTFYIY